jgi:hypothetical protein
MPLTVLTAPFKVTMYFQELDSFAQGWSETIHWKATAYADIVAALQTFVETRLELCGPDIRFESVRIAYYGQPLQDLLLNGSTWTGFTNTGSYVPTVGTDPTFSAPVDVALLCRVQDVAQFHTSAWLHGVPLAVIKGNEYLPDPSFTTSMGIWQTAYKAVAMVKKPKVAEYSLVTEFNSISVSNRKAGRTFGSKRGRR